MKYVATVEGQEYIVNVEPSGEITVDDSSRTVHLGHIKDDSLFSLLIGTACYEVFVEHSEYGTRARSCQDRYYITVEGHRHQVRVEDLRFRRRGERKGVRAGEPEERTVTSPMPGVVVAVLVQEGQPVETDESVAILEAMKMENDIRAPCDGIVKSVHVTPGQAIDLNDIIVHIGPPDVAD